MLKKGSPSDRLQPDDDFHVALLHLAVKEDDILAIKELTRVPNWIHAADRSGRNALHWAVAFGSKDACELLLSRTGEEGVHHADKIGRTPLHFAAIWGRSDIVKMILARGAQVNAPDRKGMTTLHYAAQNSNPFLIRSLIKRGANRQARDSRRRISYHVAVQWGSPKEILDLLNPNFHPEKSHKVLEMPQARRFAASLSPEGSHGATVVPHLGSKSEKDFPAELVKYEMQKQSDKTRNILRKVVVKKLKKWGPPGAHSKEFARRKKMFIERQMKKAREMKQPEQIKKEKMEAWGLGKWSRMSSQSVASSPRTGKANKQASPSKDGAISRPGSKTPPRTKSSQPSSPAAFKGAATRRTASTFSRPNTPHTYVPSSSPRPNLTARYGWPSPPGSIRDGKGGRRDLCPLKGKYIGNDVAEMAAPLKRKWPRRTPSHARLALSEFVGTSARHNALGKYPSPAVHKCIDVQKLQNQWL